MTAATPMIRMTDIRKTYRLRRGMFAPTEELVAVNDLSLEVAEGETLGLVGESGCGKSTAVSIMLGLLQPDRGEVEIAGQKIDTMPVADRVRLIQPVFQNPNARLTLSNGSRLWLASRCDCMAARMSMQRSSGCSIWSGCHHGSPMPIPGSFLAGKGSGSPSRVR